MMNLEEKIKAKKEEFQRAAPEHTLEALKTLKTA